LKIFYSKSLNSRSEVSFSFQLWHFNNCILREILTRGMRIDLKGIRALRPCLLAHFHGAYAVTVCGTKQHLRKPYRLINQGNPPAQYWKFQCTLQWRSAFSTRDRDATRFQIFAKGAKPALSISRSLIDLSRCVWHARCVCVCVCIQDISH